MTSRTRKPLRGKRELHVRDWPFGAVGRRLLLEALLIDEQPDEGWTMGQLEARAGVGNGGLNAVLPGAVALELLRLAEDAHWHVPSELPPIAKPLRKLVVSATDLADEPIVPLVKREYRRR